MEGLQGVDEQCRAWQGVAQMSLPRAHWCLMMLLVTRWTPPVQSCEAFRLAATPPLHPPWLPGETRAQGHCPPLEELLTWPVCEKMSVMPPQHALLDQARPVTPLHGTLPLSARSDGKTWPALSLMQEKADL